MLDRLPTQVQKLRPRLQPFGYELQHLLALDPRDLAEARRQDLSARIETGVLVKAMTQNLWPEKWPSVDILQNPQKHLLKVLQVMCLALNRRAICQG